MDEHEFRRILELFPVVRSRDYHPDSESSSKSGSRSAQKEELNEWQDAWTDGGNRDTEIQGKDYHDAFWNKLKSCAEKKVGATDAERFCEAFKQVYHKLVYEELSLDAARSFMNSSGIVRK